jgi:hypothetical protein
MDRSSIDYLDWRPPPRCPQQTAKDNKEHFSPECVRTLERDFYVDDLLKSVSKSQEAVILLKELCSVLEKGGFHLHKIVTNCPYVRAVASSMERVKKDTSDGSNFTIERALGVKWDADEDHFIFMLAHLKNGKHPTTRRVSLSHCFGVQPYGFYCSVPSQA